MVLPEISNSATVGNYQVLESPLIPENLLQKAGVAAAWFIIPTLIGTHHLTHLGILHQRFEGRHISFPKVARCNIGNIVCMASPFWSAMNCIVLGTSPEFAVFRIFRSLQSAHHGTSHPTGKIRILTIGFLSTSPARITEDIHVWSPDREGMETGYISSLLLQFIPFGTHLIRCCIKDSIHHSVVKRSYHSDRFRKDGYISHVRHTMQCLAPPLESLDSQSWDSRRIIQHQRSFLFQSETTT